MKLNKGQNLDYVGSKIIHTSGNLCAVISELLNCLEKLTSQTPQFDSQRVYYIHLYHTNGLYKSGFDTSILPTIEDLWIDLDLKQMVSVTENDSNTLKKTQKCLFLYCIFMSFLQIYP